MTDNKPKNNEVRLKHHAIGLNFIDINMRVGAYNLQAFAPGSQAPYILGMEASGEVESVGKEVNGFKVGDRVAHCMNLGSYSEIMNIPADRLILIPSDISYEVAAASTLQGLTAHYLVNEKRAGGTALDSVAHFHLNNGARIEQLNWAADLSSSGVEQSAGIMLNYLYLSDDIDANHESYRSGQEIILSPGVRNLLKD